MHTGKGEEGSPSEFIFLKEGDHPFCGFLIICNNILNISAKSSFYGNLIFFIHLYNIGDYADQTSFPVFIGHDFPDTVSITVIALSNIL